MIVSNILFSAFLALSPFVSGAVFVQNPGFEASTTSISPWTNQTSYTIVSPGYKSQHAVCGSGLLAISQNLPASAYSNNTLYKLNFMYRVSFPKSAAVSTFEFFEIAVGDFRDEHNGNATVNVWKSYEGYFLTDLANPPFIGVSVRGQYTNASGSSVSGEVCLDGFKVQLANGTFNTQPGATEMVPNGGFETGTLAPWSLYRDDNVTVRSPGIDSKYGLHVTFAVGQFLSQVFNVTRGTKYLLQFDNQVPENMHSLFFIGVNSDASGPSNRGILSQITWLGIEMTTIGGPKATFTTQRPFMARGPQIQLVFNAPIGINSKFGKFIMDNISVKEFLS